MKVLDEVFIEKKEEGINICILYTELGKVKGIVRCKEEDMPDYSSLLGGCLAAIVATKKYAEKSKRYYTKLLNKIEDINSEDYKSTLKRVEESEIMIKLAIDNFNKNVNDYYKGKALIKRYKKAKESNAPFSMLDSLQKQVDDLHKLKSEMENSK